MIRSKTYLDNIQAIADAALFLQNAKQEMDQLVNDVNQYLEMLNSSVTVLCKFPTLTKELQDSLSIIHFNAETSGKKIEETKAMLVKMNYIHDMLNDIEQIHNPVLEAKVALPEIKTKFINSSNKLLLRTVDTLHFEMQHFEQVFKKAVQQLNAERQKCEKIRTLINHDISLLSEFPIIQIELRNMAEGEYKGNFGTDYVISNYPAIKDSLGKLNEFSRYFARLSDEYFQILDGADLQIFQTVKRNISLSNLSGEYLRINARASEFKNRMIKLDTLRNVFTNLCKETNEKIVDLSPNHQVYVKEETEKIRELLFNKVGREFEKAEAKIFTIKDLLKREFKTNDQKATDALYIRQLIARYEPDMWEEDSKSLSEALNNFSAGKTGWKKDDFLHATENFIKKRNEALELIKKEYHLFFEKNRDYRNRFEKIANTNCTKRELEKLVNEMSTFKPLKQMFYKLIK